MGHLSIAQALLAKGADLSIADKVTSITIVHVFWVLVFFVVCIFHFIMPQHLHVHLFQLRNNFCS